MNFTPLNKNRIKLTTNVIVDSPKVSDQQFEKLNYNIWLKGLEMGQEINPVIYTRERWETKVPSLFLHNVKKEGIVL